MGLEVNSMAVPRKARQAVGGIAKLKHDDGRQMTVRDEKNDSLLGGSVVVLDQRWGVGVVITSRLGVVITSGVAVSREPRPHREEIYLGYVGIVTYCGY